MIISVKCTQCNRLIKREVNPIPPSQFTDPAGANLKSFFWCPYCEAMLGVRYAFDCNGEATGEATVTSGVHLDVSKWVTEQPVTKAITVKPKKRVR